ncbi:hypothetical protein [Halocalculus aciditolerans]|uniref:Uncharacterized protein n=1 Tax=Halocalculus aciditolerans TaxID=1383812 RepID=A0A830FA44_9EURY|nr:hypothetical protein [Halocalculus aciditolerans]GGL54979.1 hypothetical protein GCM10009039_11340 [Halocalculus aciditolerans]
MKRAPVVCLSIAALGLIVSAAAAATAPGPVWLAVDVIAVVANSLAIALIALAEGWL